MSRQSSANVPAIRIFASFIMAIGIGAALGLFVIWIQGLPGPSHGAYSAYASLVNIRSGLLFYEQSTGHLPHATTIDPMSGIRSSWRCNVYQYMVDSGFVTKPERLQNTPIAYDIHKAWNDPHNLRLEDLGDSFFQYMPIGQHSPRPGNDHFAYYKAITGPGTAFDALNTSSATHLPDDLVLIVRVENSDTHWMEPGDLNVEQLDVSETTQSLLCGENGYAVLFADGAPWVLSNDLPISELRKFFTIEGAKQYDRDRILAPYRVLP